MRCHHHPQFEAVAVCVSCGRGVCHDCQPSTSIGRILCGLPQCAEFAKKQTAVQFAMRQDCANNATNYQTLASFMKSFAGLLLVVSLMMLISSFLLGSFMPWISPPSRVEAVVVAGILMILAGMFTLAARKLRRIGQVYEDVTREFS